MAAKPKMPPLRAELTYTPDPGPVIEVVHPDGFTQLFTGLGAFLYKASVLTDGQEAALENARTRWAGLALKQYYPESRRRLTESEAREARENLQAWKNEKRRRKRLEQAAAAMKGG